MRRVIRVALTSFVATVALFDAATNQRTFVVQQWIESRIRAYQVRQWAEKGGRKVGIAFDAASSIAADTGNLSWTHTPTGTPRGVVVQIIQNVGTTDEVTGVTYGGVAMARVTGATVFHTTGSEDGAVYTYFLGSGLPTGAQTVEVTVTGTGSEKDAAACTVTAASNTDVDTSGTLDSGGTTNPSVSLTTTVETFVVAALHSGVNSAANLSPGANFTELFEENIGANQVASFERRTSNPAAGSVTVDWVCAISEEFGIGAVAIKELPSFDSSISLAVMPAVADSAGLSVGSSSTLSCSPGASIAAAMVLASSAALNAAPTAAQGTALTTGPAIILGAAGVAGPSSVAMQNAVAAIDALPAILTAAGVPVDAAVSFAAALQFIIVEPPQNLDSAIALAAANGLTLAAKSIPQVSMALAQALGLNAASGFAYNSQTTMAAQAGIATVAQQIVNTAVLTGAGLAILPVASGIFRSVVIGPAGLASATAAQASPVAQLALIAGMGLTTEAQAGWAAAIAAGIVLSIQQQAQAVHQSMISLGATPAQAMSAAVAFQSMLALGVVATCRADTAFGAALTGSVIQIIRETYQVADIQD